MAKKNSSKRKIKKKKMQRTRTGNPTENGTVQEQPEWEHLSPPWQKLYRRVAEQVQESTRL